MIDYLKENQSPVEKADAIQLTTHIKSMLKTNFEQLLSHQNSFDKVNTQLWNFYEHVNERVYYDKLKDFSAD